MYQSFEALKEARLDPKAPRKRLIVAGATDEHAVEAAFAAQKKGYITPILVGEEVAVTALVQRLGFDQEPYEIVPCDPDKNPSSVAVSLVHQKRGDMILKGKLETRDLLLPILNKETGLNDSGFITHFGLMQIKGYHKLLAMSDSAVIPHPTLEEKMKIIGICMEMLRRLGYQKPVAGALCAAETVSPKIIETVEARQLQELSEQGAFGDGIVVGPISLDLAMRKESALIKGYTSPYAGDVDLLLVPNMVTGNVMSKIWNVDPDNILAGCLVGAQVPIALTSRSASTNEKLYSILLCSLLAVNTDR